MPKPRPCIKALAKRAAEKDTKRWRPVDSLNMKPNERGLTTAQQRILWLLVLSAWLNFIDRGALSAAAPALQADLRLTPVQLGYLLSAFFWTYAGCQVITGWLVDRFEVSRLYAAGFLVWSAATLFTGFAGAFAGLFALRLVLGIGESTAYPAYARILSREFPEHRRGLANALIDAASKTGPGVATFIGGLIITAFGWRAMFIGLGAVSLLWFPFWVRWAPQDERRATALRSRHGCDFETGHALGHLHGPFLL